MRTASRSTGEPLEDRPSYRNGQVPLRVRIGHPYERRDSEPSELLLISDVKYDEFEGQIDAEVLYREMTHAFICSTCRRLWIYWDGFQSAPTEYERR